MAEPHTLTELFFSATDRFPERPVALRRKVGGRWEEMSYRALVEQVRAASAALRALDARPGDRVAILSENRPEWAVTDYASLATRVVDVPLYPVLPPGQIEYILRDAGAVALFVSTAEQLEKIRQIRSRLPALREVIVFDPPGPLGAGERSFAAFLELGRGAEARFPGWRDEALAARPDDVATLIYTSGTTGDPKGVMLTHGNITSNVVAGLAVLPLRETDECLSLLPLSHIFERMAGHYCMFHAGAVINYASSIETVAAELVERRPTVVCSVPRLFEKIYGRVLDTATGGSPVKRWIFFWARGVGERWVDLTLAGRRVPAGLAARYALARKLVFHKLQARVGGRLRFFVSGGAPLNAEIQRFFYAAGLPILEGYGLTETSPVIAVNGPGRTRLGTVGRPIPGAQVRIANDGEILTRGPSVMKGYFNLPQATAEAIDADGWFHTGDIGALDADGYLRITDRKKDLIVTAGGKNIAPQPIENLAKRNRFVANAVMLGDRRKFPIMLLVPNFTTLGAWATRKGLGTTDPETLLALVEVRDKLDRELGRTFAGLAHYEVPKKLLLLPADFSIEGGDLTPTLKVRRRIVEQKYRDRIDALYAEAESETRHTGVLEG